MMIDFIRACLGAIHEFVSPEYIPLVDAITAPIIVVILVGFSCGISVIGVRAIIRAIWSGVRK